MFENEMKESKEKSVEIKEAEPEVVREMLRYFYTEGVNNLTEMGTKLYELADRYMVDKLKVLSTDSLIQSVNKENALDMYCFGRNKEINALTKEAERVLIE